MLLLLLPQARVLVSSSLRVRSSFTVAIWVSFGRRGFSGDCDSVAKRDDGESEGLGLDF